MTTSRERPIAIIGAGPSGPAAGAHVAGNASACCGGPAPAAVEACCVLDAEATAAGRDGCGCGSAAPMVASMGPGIGHPAGAGEPARRPRCA